MGDEGAISPLSVPSPLAGEGGQSIQGPSLQLWWVKLGRGHNTSPREPSVWEEGSLLTHALRQRCHLHPCIIITGTLTQIGIVRGG